MPLVGYPHQTGIEALPPIPSTPRRLRAAMRRRRAPGGLAGPPMVSTCAGSPVSCCYCWHPGAIRPAARAVPVTTTRTACLAFRARPPARRLSPVFVESHARANRNAVAAWCTATQTAYGAPFIRASEEPAFRRRFLAEGNRASSTALESRIQSPPVLQIWPARGTAERANRQACEELTGRRHVLSARNARDRQLPPLAWQSGSRGRRGIAPPTGSWTP